MDAGPIQGVGGHVPHEIEKILSHSYQSCSYRFEDCTCIFGAIEALKNEVRRLETRRLNSLDVYPCCGTTEAEIHNEDGCEIKRLKASLPMICDASPRHLYRGDSCQACAEILALRKTLTRYSLDDMNGCVDCGGIGCHMGGCELEPLLIPTKSLPCPMLMAHNGDGSPTPGCACDESREKATSDAHECQVAGCPSEEKIAALRDGLETSREVGEKMLEVLLYLKGAVEAAHKAENGRPVQIRLGDVWDKRICDAVGMARKP